MMLGSMLPFRCQLTGLGGSCDVGLFAGAPKSIDVPQGRHYDSTMTTLELVSYLVIASIERETNCRAEETAISCTDAVKSTR